MKHSTIKNKGDHFYKKVLTVLLVLLCLVLVCACDDTGIPDGALDNGTPDDVLDNPNEFTQQNPDGTVKQVTQPE